MVSNRVRGNGAVASGAPTLADANRGLREGSVVGSFGPRFQGGIVIAPPESARPPDTLNEDAPRNVHIRRNVVEQADAVALFVRSRGACRINGNFFQSRAGGGNMTGPAVLVFSAGKPWEAVDLPQGEPNQSRWLQPNMSREFLNGRAQELPDGDGGALCFNGNQVTTSGTSTPPEGGFGAWLFSLDHVTAVGNQFAARSADPFPRPHVMAVGVTADFSVNRVAESVVQTNVSLAAMAAMLTACAGNMLTHCPAVFGCVNHQNPDFFVAEDNQVWFRPAGGRCEEATRSAMAALQNLCGGFFNSNPTVIGNPIIIRGR